MSAIAEILTSRRKPQFVGENDEGDLWGLTSGAVPAVDELYQLVAAGYGFHVTVGAFSTPIVGGGGDGTIIDADRPELSISVPSGSAIMPIRISVQLELPADADGKVEEILIAADRTAASTSSASTGTAETIFNTRTDNARSSACTVISAGTVNMATAPTLGLELARKQMVVNVLTAGITQGIFDLVYEPKIPPILIGPCALYVYFGGDTTVPSGFIQAQWVEMPAALNSLWGGS